MTVEPVALEQHRRMVPRVVEGRMESPEDWAVRIGLIPDLATWYVMPGRTGMKASTRLLLVLAYEEARRKSWTTLDVLQELCREIGGREGLAGIEF